MSSFRKRVAPDFTKDFLAQYDLEDDEDGVEPEIEEEVEPVVGEEKAAEEDDVQGVSRKRPKMTAELVAGKLDAFLGPKFRSLHEIKTPEQWVSKLLRLYEEWADSVFPSVGLEQFLKRLEKMSGTTTIKNAMFELCRKRARMQELEEEDNNNAAAEMMAVAEADFPELAELQDVPKENEAAPQISRAEPESDDELVLLFDE
jgi:hypothetical protein